MTFAGVFLDAAHPRRIGEDRVSLRNNAMRRGSVVIVLLLLVSLNLYVLLSRITRPERVEPEESPEHVVSSPFIDAVDARIAEHVAELKAEDCVTSVARLGSLKLYFWPGSHLTDTVNFETLRDLPVEVDGWTTHRILSNRRVLKVYASCLDGSCPQAREILLNDLDNMLEVYQRLYDTTITNLTEILTKDPQLIESVAFPITDAADGQPMVNSLRLRILATLLILSQVEEQRVFPIAKKIADLAVRQHDELESNPALNPTFRLQFLIDASLYHRTILATALRRTAPTELRRQLSDDLLIRPLVIKVVDFDARATPYDQHVLARVRSVDYPKQDRVVVLEQVSDKHLRGLLGQLSNSK